MRSLLTVCLVAPIDSKLKGNSVRVSPNNLLAFCLLQEFLLLFSIFSPFLALGVHLVSFCALLNVGVYLLLNRIVIRGDIPVSGVLRQVTRIFTIAAAAGIVPMALFLY